MKTRRSIKCVVEPCRFDGHDAVKKRLERNEPPWDFYMRREIALHRAFRALHLPVRTPRMLDAGAGFIVFERIDGQPLAAQRHVVPQDRDVWEGMIAIALAIRSVAVTIDVAPTDEDRRAMRARLLEDPTAPTEWIASGLTLCASRGLIQQNVASKLAGDVKGAVFQHGDLLLRNVMRDASGFAIVDWECAGTHADGWDGALLSVFAPPWARTELARGCDPTSFHACYVFALLREMFFRRGKNDDVTARLEEALAAALRV